MPAFLIAEFLVKDPAKMQEYAATAGPVVGQFGGKILVRAPAKVLVGSRPATTAVIIQFDTMHSVERFLASDAYRRAVPIRDAAADATFLAVEAP
jgi:uncharacterized protein (DUF1330 family)